MTAKNGPGHKRHTPTRWRTPALAFAALGLAASSSFLSAQFLYGDPTRVAPAPGLVRSPAPVIVGLGYLEPASTIVTIGAPGNPDASRVARLSVTEGQDVEAGDALAVLDTADRLGKQLAAAQEQVQLKRLTLSRQRLDVAYSAEARRADLDRARADFQAARSTLDREQQLFAQGYSTVARIEEKQREVTRSQATVLETEAALDRAEAISGPRSPGATPMSIDVAITRQELALAQSDVAVARAALDLAVIRAPFKGRVLALHAHPGERIGAEGLLELGAIDRMRAVVEVYQSDVGRIHIGQTAKLTTDALDAPLVGTVEHVGNSVRRQTVVNNDPATATDSRVVEVRLALDAQTSRVVATLSRLQVRAAFQ